MVLLGPDLELKGSLFLWPGGRFVGFFDFQCGIVRVGSARGL